MSSYMQRIGTSQKLILLPLFEAAIIKIRQK